MRITRLDIIQKFDALENETESREAIANFAIHAMEARDTDSLELDGPDSDKLWTAITYLSGVDLKESPEIYLHSKDNFSDYRRKLDL